jgi:hypothetical protein
MERRAKERYRVWFPMTVVTSRGDEGTAITYDVSAAGLSMACPGKLELGERVTLRFRIDPGDASERSYGGEVVRVEGNDGEDGPWRFRMAIRFDEPHPELEGILEAHVEEPKG